MIPPSYCHRPSLVLAPILPHSSCTAVSTDQKAYGCIHIAVGYLQGLYCRPPIKPHLHQPGHRLLTRLRQRRCGRGSRCCPVLASRRPPLMPARLVLMVVVVVAVVTAASPPATGCLRGKV